MNKKQTVYQTIHAIRSAHDDDDLFVCDDERSVRRELSAEEHEKQKKRRRGVGIMVGILLLFGFGTAAFFRLWRITDFRVEGLSAVTKEEVLRLADIPDAVPMYRYRPKEWAERMQNDPRIVVRDISFALPNRCTITIDERSEYAVVQVAQQYVYFDENAIVLDITSKPKQQDSLLVRGLSVSGFTVKEELGVRDAYQIYVLKELMQALQKTGQRGWYVLADLTNSVDVCLWTNQDIQVCLGAAAELPEKLMNISAVLNTLEAEGEKGGRLDAIRPDNIIYSPKDGEAETDSDEMSDVSESNEPSSAAQSEEETTEEETLTAEDEEANAQNEGVNAVQPSETPAAFATAAPSAKPQNGSEENPLFDQIPNEP